jgi:hypothetical protein
MRSDGRAAQPRSSDDLQPRAGAGVTGDGTAHHALAHPKQTAWANFARSGDPNHSGLPAWPRFDVRQRSTMIFDTVCPIRSARYGLPCRQRSGPDGTPGSGRASAEYLAVEDVGGSGRPKATGPRECRVGRSHRGCGQRAPDQSRADREPEVQRTVARTGGTSVRAAGLDGPPPKPVRSISRPGPPLSPIVNHVAARRPVPSAEPPSIPAPS